MFMNKENIVLYSSIVLILAGVWMISSSLQGAITAFAVSNGTQTTASVTVNEFISLTLQEGFPISFGSLNPGATNASATTNPSNITIGGETNVDYNITLNATSDFHSDTAGVDFSIGNMSFYTTNVSQTDFQLNTELAAYEYPQTCPCGTTVNKSIWFFISIPAGQKAANDYQANLTIAARGGT